MKYAHLNLPHLAANSFSHSASQFHEGLGFLTNHGLLTNTFEYSLQQVNPKLTVPYWDFTIEGSVIGDSGKNDIVDLLLDESPIFQESWFGTFDRRDNMVGYSPRGVGCAGVTVPAFELDTVTTSFTISTRTTARCRRQLETNHMKCAATVCSIETR